MEVVINKIKSIILVAIWIIVLCLPFYILGSILQAESDAENELMELQKENLILKNELLERSLNDNN